MWIVIGITLTATVITLRSMRTLVFTQHIHIPEKTEVKYTHYIVTHAENLPYILNSILHQLHIIRREMTVEIVYMPKQVEFILHLPESIQISEHLHHLIPIESLWSNQYGPELIVDDTDSIQSQAIAHQIIIKAKTPTIVFITTRSIKKTPDHYIISGIDSYKWNKFINKVSDMEPEISTHDRIYTIIQEKLMSY